MNRPSTPPPRSSGAGSNGRYLWIGIGVVVVALLAIVAVVALGGGDDKKDTANETGKVEVGKNTGTTSGSGDTSGDTSGGPATTAAGGGQALPTFEAGGQDPAVGRTIPSISGTSISGQPITIAPDGKGKLLIFVAHWCPHCQREVPKIVQWLKDQRAPSGVEVQAVSTGVRADAPNYPPTAWLERENWTIPTLADSEGSEAATAFGLSSFPYFVAVDSQGKVTERTSGELTEQQFRDLIASASGGG